LAEHDAARSGGERPAGNRAAVQENLCAGAGRQNRSAGVGDAVFEVHCLAGGGFERSTISEGAGTCERSGLVKDAPGLYCGSARVGIVASRIERAAVPHRQITIVVERSESCEISPAVDGETGSGNVAGQVY